MKQYTKPEELVADITKALHLSKWGQISLLAFPHNVLEQALARMYKSSALVRDNSRIGRYKYFIGICRGIATDSGVEPDYDLVSQTEQEHDKPFKASPIIEEVPGEQPQIPSNVISRVNNIVNQVQVLNQILDDTTNGLKNPDIEQAKRDLAIYQPIAKEQNDKALKEREGTPTFTMSNAISYPKPARPHFLFVGRIERGNMRKTPGNMGMSHDVYVGLFDQTRTQWYQDIETEARVHTCLTDAPFPNAKTTTVPGFTTPGRILNDIFASKAAYQIVLHALSEEDILYYLSIAPIYLRGKITDLQYGISGQLPHEKKQSLPR